MTDRRQFTIVVEVAADPLWRRGERERTPEVRLRQLLKLATRSCGFRVVEVKPEPEAPKVPS